MEVPWASHASHLALRPQPVPRSCHHHLQDSGSVFLASVVGIPHFRSQISVSWHGGVTEEQQCVYRLLKLPLCLPIAVVLGSGSWGGLSPGIVPLECSVAWRAPSSTTSWGLPSCPGEAVMEEMGHFCLDLGRVAHRFAFCTNHTALLQYCFHFPSLASGFLKLTVLAGATCFSTSTSIRASLTTAGPVFPPSVSALCCYCAVHSRTSLSCSS